MCPTAVELLTLMIEGECTAYGARRIDQQFEARTIGIMSYDQGVVQA